MIMRKVAFYPIVSLNLLAALMETLLHRSLPKPNGVRCGNWEACPLTPEQQMYAAQDAFASLAAYCALYPLPLRVPVGVSN